MTRQEYNDFREWGLPENENGDDVGFLVEDSAGQKNTPQYDGYVQWLPKAEFERKFAIEDNESDTGEGKPVTEQELAEKAAAPRVTKNQIDALMDRVVVHTTTCITPIPHVLAIAWLDDKFYLGTAISKSVNPENFNEEIGIQYSTKDVLEIAENKLWELEGYRLFHG
ncbi:hypothetical protein HLH16_08730 [Acinetobacter sp. ANC 5378]|nr:hypothetical protein [Acinetobacter sp. ANC 5378]